MPSVKKSKSSKSIYFLIPAPLGISPGQRFRFELYLDILHQQGIHFTISSFYTMRGWRILFTNGNILPKVLAVLSGFFKRFLDLFRLLSFDYIFIYREATPIGPPFFEFLISRVFRKKIIYDFDDAIWIPSSSEYNYFISFLKGFSKVRMICRWSFKVSVGNAYLGAFASKYNSRVVILPTVVNTEEAHTQLQNHNVENVVVGWTGSFSTLKFLNDVLSALQRVQEKYDFEFIVIADNDPKLPLKRYRFIKWNKQTETEDLLKMQIGLMPLYDDELTRGKCGFKAIQYMALGIPAVVSPVGVNTEIVEDGDNGYICYDEEDWVTKLSYLISNREKRAEMGLNARIKIINQYSVIATRDKFLTLFTP
jgi:glycosyltransferase involved in cell wall biosynthesis